jgi:hypothetical protein
MGLPVHMMLTWDGRTHYSRLLPTSRERSSAVEHTVHIGVVTGSIPVAPTILGIDLVSF